MPRLIKAAILCGAVPLLTGTLIYLTWRATRWDILILAGMITIGAGLLAFISGAACLLCQARRASGDLATHRRLRTQSIFALALLLINFPAAALFTLSAIDVETRYTVRVHNDTDLPIESLVVIGPGVHAELGPIAPGRRVRQHLRFHGAGPLDFTGRQQKVEFSGELEGYVTGGWRGERSIRVRPGGIVELHPSNAQPREGG